MNKKSNRLNPYLSFDKMDAILNGVQKSKSNQSKELQGTDMEYLKILRILCRYYLSNIHLHFVFNKLKLQSLSKRYHIMGMRKILNVIQKSWWLFILVWFIPCFMKALSENVFKLNHREGSINLVTLTFS